MNRTFGLALTLLFVACLVNVAIASDQAQIDAAKTRTVDAVVDVLEAGADVQGFGS